MHIIQMAQEQHAIYFGYAFFRRFSQISRNRKAFSKFQRWPQDVLKLLKCMLTNIILINMLKQLIKVYIVHLNWNIMNIMFSVNETC